MRIFPHILFCVAWVATAAAQGTANASAAVAPSGSATASPSRQGTTNASAAAQGTTNGNGALPAVSSAGASPNRPGTTNGNAAVAQGTTNANAAVALALDVGGFYVLDDKHLLEAGDRISFQILEDRDPAKSLIVADSRELDVPYIGRVSVADKTCKQLAKELKVLLEKEFYIRATVIIGLDSVNKVRGKVYLMGQVRAQGAVDLLFDEKLTAGQAILRAGGFMDFANKGKVKVTRNAGAGSTSQIFEVNMTEVLEKGKADKDVTLEPGDLIFVPTRAVNF